MRLVWNVLKLLTVTAAIVLAALLFGSHAVVSQASTYVVGEADVGEAQAAIVPGASVLRSGVPSDILADRLTVAYQLYHDGKVEKILLSGDHGQDDYDEVTVMKNFLLQKGVPEEALILDDAGFDTYDTMYRAKQVFGVESAVVVTQGFHLPRSLYLARSLGIAAVGVSSDLQTYKNAWYYDVREWFADVKAVANIVLKSQPATIQ